MVVFYQMKLSELKKQALGRLERTMEEDDVMVIQISTLLSMIKFLSFAKALIDNATVESGLSTKANQAWVKAFKKEFGE